MTDDLRYLLSQIKCKKTYLRKSEMCSGNAYRVTLTHRGKRCSFTFHDNFKNKSSKKDFLYCLYLDAGCFEESQDIYDFAYTFGYEHTAKAERAYKACEKQSKRLHKLFTDVEIEILSTIE